MRFAPQLVAPVLAVLAVVAVLTGCGAGAPVERVQRLQIHGPAPIAADAGKRPALRVSLSAPAAAAALPPPMQVPQVGSIAVGATNAGRLVNGLQLPGTGPDWVTWDPILRAAPNRPDRRWGTDRLLAFVLYVLRDYRLANPGAPPLVIGDLSRPGGGRFGADFGGLGHVSHQNGLDADVYYPRLDRTLRPPERVEEVDRALAQDLVSRFVAAGAQFAFVGLRVGLGGPAGVVQAIAHHDGHVHIRIANARR